MTTAESTGTRAYYSKLAGALGNGAQSVGVAEGWIAPVAVFAAPAGFGEECWLEESPVTVIASRLGGARVEWLCGPAAGRSSGRSSVALQPRGAPNFARARGPIRFAQTFLSDSLIDRVADSIRPGAKAGAMLRNDVVFLPDRELEDLTAAHVRTAMTGATALELEASAILLVSRILRRYHGFAEPAVRRGGLAPWQIRRACDVMEAHLAEDIGLDMLAGVAGCSPAHFGRAFKQSTGLTPFQWLLQRRIDHARTLLTDPDQTLAGIALAVGFSAQPQFTTAFRRVTGITPGAWRRQAATRHS